MLIEVWSTFDPQHMLISLFLTTPKIHAIFLDLGFQLIQILFLVYSPSPEIYMPTKVGSYATSNTCSQLNLTYLEIPVPCL